MTNWIGPVEVASLDEPQLNQSATPTALGIQTFTLSGLMEWTPAHQLRELVNNRHRRVTIGGQTGVLEPLWFGDNLLGPLNSWALLQSFQLGQVDQTHSLHGTTGLVPYTFTAALLGDASHRQVVAVRSARDKGNDFGLSAVSFVANPFWDEDPAGGPFITNPGGTRFTREYDPSFPHDPTVSTATARQMTLYSAPFVSGEDQLSLVVLPALSQSSDGPPKWITDRGGDVRGYNRSERREVYGTPHHLDSATDLQITNGLVDFWIGNEGLVPFLNWRSFRSGTWREEGTVQFGSSHVLQGARLVSVTPDAAVAGLTIAGKGDLFVTLKRGEPFLRITPPDSSIRPTWSGTPPTSRATQAANGAGKFGNGLDAGGDDATWSDPSEMWSDPRFMWDGTRVNPDIRFLWPPKQAQTAFTRVLWYTPNKAAADLAGAGFLTAYGASGEHLLTLYFDEGTNTVKLTAAGATLTSAAQTFTLGQHMFLVARWSETSGLALSVRSPAGTVAHYADTTATDLDGTLTDVAYLANFGLAYGEGYYGEGYYGGTTLYPDGVIDNDMLFDSFLSNAEVEALAAATTPLGGLPVDKMPVWYGPYDAIPIVSLGADSGGRSIDAVTDANGLQKAVAFLDSEHLEAVALLARTGDTAADQHAQAAAENRQEVRVR